MRDNNVRGFIRQGTVAISNRWFEGILTRDKRTTGPKLQTFERETGQGNCLFTDSKYFSLCKCWVFAGSAVYHSFSQDRSEIPNHRRTGFEIQIYSGLYF